MDNEYDRGTFGNSPTEVQSAADPVASEDRARDELRLWRRWTADGDPQRYPYPDEHAKSQATGELAERIRRALGAGDPTDDVFLVESKKYGGYSENTQDNFRWLTVECGDLVKDFRPESYGMAPSAFAMLLAWLDESAPKAVHCAGCACR